MPLGEKATEETKPVLKVRSVDYPSVSTRCTPTAR
jgi:hypothetical protein